MWLNDIILKKYNINGYNNPTEYVMGFLTKLTQRKEGIRRAYLVGVPEHGNMGDQAIVLAMKKFVETNNPNMEVCVFPISSFLDTLPAIQCDCAKDDLILLVGGGNMGVAYFGNEEVRRLMIKMFPRNRIIIFPQTIDYGDDIQQFENAIKIYSKHRDLHIFAREQVSYDIMKKHFKDNSIYLTPDIVYTLTYEGEFNRHGILACIRNDRESAFSSQQIKSMMDELESKNKVVKTTTVMPYVPIISSEEIREKLVFRKIEEFAKAEIVVTDRLHGLIFAVITYTPCIVLPSFDHKLISSYYTWLEGFPDIVFMEAEDSLSELIDVTLQQKNHRMQLDEIRCKFNTLKDLLR